jgi:hypothetical protein
MKSKLEKQKEAEERAAHRSKMSHKDQIARLDSSFGKDLGATKERARLKALIEGSKSPKIQKEPSESNSTEKPKKPRKKKNEES